MTATIVVPSRGGAHRLPVLFESVRRQTRSDLEVIVVVDGDVDDSARVVEKAAADLPVRAVVFPENRGRAAALNAGFAAAEGDVLIRADDDLELEPDFVDHHVRLHEAQRCGVVAMCRDVFPDSAYARAYGADADEKIREAALTAGPDDTWRWWSGNVSTTRQTYDEVGPYDEAFRAYGWEDVDWGYRLHLLGVPIVIPTGFSTLHHGPVTSTLERVQRAFASGAASERFVQKHGPGPLAERGGRSGVWDLLVDAGARLSTERSVATTGRALDAVVGRLPHWPAEKLVALAVQSAARGGRRYPHRIRTHV
jgi:glycosyltransferase involved in cell wall biosynthesis